MPGTEHLRPDRREGLDLPQGIHVTPEGGQRLRSQPPRREHIRMPGAEHLRLDRREGLDLPQGIRVTPEGGQRVRSIKMRGQ